MAIQNINPPRIRPTVNNIPPALVLDTAKSEQSEGSKNFAKATAPSIPRAKKLRRLYHLSGDGCMNIIDHANEPKPHARLLTTICCCFTLRHFWYAYPDTDNILVWATELSTFRSVHTTVVFDLE